jgi:hypothetical protein
MVQRHLTIPHRFICFTENPERLNSLIEVRSLPIIPDIQGWWWKTYIFSDSHFNPEDTNLFFDLDMVIIKNINKLIEYESDHFLGLQDVGRIFNKPDKLGSAVMRWRGHKHKELWTRIKDNPGLTRRYPGGDQDYIWGFCKEYIKFFPPKWIMSYKWEVRNKKDIIRLNGKNVFQNIADPKIDPETAVLAFHGTPNLEDTQDKIIVENWQ